MTRTREGGAAGDGGEGMTAESKWEYVRGDNPWARAYRCTTCGFVSELETLRHECDICAAITAAVEERERECIRIQCEMCASGNAPHRIDEVHGALSPWWEHCMEEGTADECDASPLHEAIYQRDRKLREGKG